MSTSLYLENLKKTVPFTQTFASKNFMEGQIMNARAKMP